MTEFVQIRDFDLPLKIGSLLDALFPDRFHVKRDDGTTNRV